MKIKLFLVLVVLLVSNCSSDDNVDSFDLSLIEGVWQFNDNTFYMSDGSIIEGAFPETCGEQSIIRINADNSIESVELYTDNCVPISSNNPYVEWEYLGNGNFKFYRLNTSMETIGFQRLKITFPATNQMKWNVNAPGLFESQTYDSLDYNLTME